MKKFSLNILKLTEGKKTTGSRLKDYEELIKNLKKESKKDVRNYNKKLINNTIEENRGLEILLILLNKKNK